MIDTEGTEETHHATVRMTDAIAIVPTEMIVQSLPGGTSIAPLEIIKILLPDVKRTADGEITRGQLLPRSKNATTSVGSAGVHLLHAAETIHKAYLLDLDASNTENSDVHI